MAYDTKLAERVRQHLALISDIEIEEKRMFGGLAFMVNGKMCVNVSGDNLMCRFKPDLEDTISGKKGFQQVVMKGKVYKGYCYVSPEGIESKKNFEFWVNLCLAFNSEAKASTRR